MKPKILFYLFFIMLLSMGNSCEKDPDNTCREESVVHSCIKQKGFVCMYYDVTKCEAVGNSNSDLLKNKIDYLKQEGVNQIIDAYIDDKGCVELCEACTCKNGKRIYGKVEESNLQIMLKNGFKELK